jgi:hypothetical protein
MPNYPEIIQLLVGGCPGRPWWTRSPSTAPSSSTSPRTSSTCRCDLLCHIRIPAHVSGLMAGLVVCQRGKFRDGYILMQDSVTRDPKALARSSLSLTKFAETIRSIRAKHKILILDPCHVDKPTVRGHSG